MHARDTFHDHRTNISEKRGQGERSRGARGCLNMNRGEKQRLGLQFCSCFATNSKVWARSTGVQTLESMK